VKVDVCVADLCKLEDVDRVVAAATNEPRAVRRHPQRGRHPLWSLRGPVMGQLPHHARHQRHRHRAHGDRVHSSSRSARRWTHDRIQHGWASSRFRSKRITPPPKPSSCTSGLACGTSCQVEIFRITTYARAVSSAKMTAGDHFTPLRRCSCPWTRLPAKASKPFGPASTCIFQASRTESAAPSRACLRSGSPPRSSPPNIGTP